ncbi:hypothetical protein BCR39DRAFT_317288 [Naematelia encephala]|uniref:RRM domain-containing protein n=1 Tax=Naematelia encephala TaxID=71784 RepID=A0A1Y2AR29_9TREE|nr:hypothetical protein BCR39DRAFT_317288 [Naematelia encephala]
MSRLIFTNLPSSFTSDQLHSHLTSPAPLAGTTITDAKLVSRRRFAFVGYKTEDEARKVKEWFDGSFALGGGKVKVDFVRDEPLAPRPAKRVKVAIPDDKPSDAVKAPSKQLQEFMSVMKGIDEPVASSSKSADAAVPGEEGWTVDGMRKEKDSSKKGKGKAEVEVPAQVEEMDDDAAWLRRRQTAALEGTESEQRAPDESLILSTGRLFVRNLAFVTTSADLSDHFSPYGQIDEVHLPVSQTTGEPLGTAFILFHDPANALTAYKALDKTTFQGRLLHVLPGRAKPGQENSGVQGVVDGKVLGKVAESRGEVKGKVDARRKDEGSKGVNWATMYMNSDAVASSIASRLNISKSDLLSSSDDSNPAVKLALAETHVIEETKKYFEDAGIVLEALSPRTPRSQTTILVKNIPFGTTTEALSDLFSSHGDITRLLLPPSGTLGVVEFKNPSDAAKAFKALNYRRLGNAVLYLEKGPVGMFTTLKSSTKVEDERALLAEKMDAAPDAPAETDEAGATLFLKNLNFSTTTPRLISLLSSLPGFSFARVQTKPDPKRPGERLSMGYGFVGFKTKQDATKALAGLRGFEVDGKDLEVKFAQRGADEKDSEEMKGKTKSTKVLVKNLPFEASKKDVRDLFSAYGTLKSLRVPKKSLPTSSGSSSTRGFAFLEFTTHAEAVRAMEALKHTHLLGRHLVLEWAKEGDGVDVDALREKSGRDVRAVGKDKTKSGKRKFEVGGANGEELDGLEV